ncbi:hypothetical protein [Massilia sp. CF038]|uniref:hypothetical protein n=1 Tax=Massilia sp. CF038 TaxID=1881045 RepID=UPI0015B5CE80|nr:hypothetical protein [Massilia sp. CF038]
MIASGQPIGAWVDVGEMIDPLYAGGNWEKFETETIQDTWRQGDAQTMQKRIRVHYMFNHVMKQIAQVKLKNSYQSGCVGIAKG